MQKVTADFNFYENTTPQSLVGKFGSPLYVYNERIFRKHCRDVLDMCEYPKFSANFSIKANSNLTLLKIAREEGLCADAVSEGEVRALLYAGFAPSEIFFVANNVGEDEMRFAVEHDVMISIDSLSQLEMFGKINAGGFDKKCAVRLNPGLGAGHHEKVVTAGEHTKFGVNMSDIGEVKKIAERFNITIAGLHHHIGSGFDTPLTYKAAAEQTLKTALLLPDLEFIDLGGGFNIPYFKSSGEKPVDVRLFGEIIDELAYGFTRKTGRELGFKIEPGRYICAESGVLLGTVHTVKRNNLKYVGTDIGINTLIRPAMYDSWHDIEIYNDSQETETVTVVGNICEMSDILAKNRVLPIAEEGDIIAVLDAGAYGMSMASNYNSRLRPAEVLLRENGETALIRRRDTYEDLIAPYIIG